MTTTVKVNPLLRAALLCAALGTALPTLAADKLLATVNGTKITEATYTDYVSENPEKANAPKDQVVGELVSRELLYQDAVKRKVDKSPEFKENMEKLRVRLMMNTALSAMIKDKPVTEADMRKEYDSQISGFDSKEYKARHILVDSEEKAKELIKKVDGGADFSALAKENSSDKGSGANGGDLGWFVRKRMVQPFGDAVAKLEKGKHTKEPVQSQFGWHVIVLDDVRSTQPPSFESVKPKLEQFLQQQRLAEYLDGLKKGAKVSIEK